MPFLIAFFVLLVIGWAGITAVNTTAKRTLSRKSPCIGAERLYDPTPVHTPRDATERSSDELTEPSESIKDEHLEELVRFLSANGMMGAVNRPEDKLTRVEDRLLSEMVGVLINRSGDLYRLHHYRLRVRYPDKKWAEALKRDWELTNPYVLLTPDYAIPFHYSPTR
jgi:hypothetical protein